MPEQPFRVTIVDDEPPARAKLRHYLEKYPNFAVCGEASTGTEAIQMLAVPPSLLFLDIELPDMSGFDVLRARPLPPECIAVFATAHDQHALHAFDAQALDYLVKPISPLRFGQMMARVERRLLEMRDAAMVRSTQPPEAPYLEQLQCRSGTRSYWVNTKEISYIEAARNYVVVYANSEAHVLRRTLESLESSLDPNHFVRISRSVIVNIGFIKAAQILSHGDRSLELKTGQHVICSRKYSANYKILFRP
jgi:two-component system, LytTR family, response regulator